MRLNLKSTAAAGLLSIALWSPGVSPAADEPERSAQLHELWVPTSRLGTVLRQMPEAVMLDRAEFERLQQAAAARGGWLDGQPLAPPESAVIRRADADLHDHGDLIRLEVRLEVDSLSDDWSVLPLDLPADRLIRVTPPGANGEEGPVRATLVRGAPQPEPQQPQEQQDPQLPQEGGADAQQQQAQQQLQQPQAPPESGPEPAAGTPGGELLLLVQGEGRLELTVELLLPVTQLAGRRQFELPASPAPVGRVSMQRGAAELLAPPFESIDDGVAAAWPRSGDAAAANLPNALTWQLLDAADPVLDDGASQLRLWSEVHVAPGRVGHRVRFLLTSQLRPLPDQLTLTLPQGARAHRVDGGDLRDWSQDGDLLEVRLQSPPRASLRRQVDLVLHYDVPLPPAGADGLTEHQLDWLSTDLADSVEGRLVINVGDGLRLLELDADDAMQLDLQAAAGVVATDGAPTQRAVLPPDRERLAAGRYTGPVGPVTLRLRTDQPRLAADLDTRVVLRRHEIAVTRRLLLRPIEGDVFVTTLTLPDEEQVTVVTLDDGSEPDWRSDGSQLTIHWSAGVVAGTTQSVTIESRRQPDGWFELGQDPVALGFTSAAVAGVDRLAGYVAVDFDDSFDVLTAVEDGLEKRDAATSPAAGRVAWFRLDDYRLELAVSRRAPEVTAQVMQHALPLAGSLEIEGGLRLDIRHSGLKTLQVEMAPEVAPALRWRAPQISEDRLDPATGTWTLVFREDIEGVQLLRWQMSLAHPELEQGDGVEVQARFANQLPTMRVPSARRLAGHVVVEANTDTELRFEPAGLDPLDALAAPRLPGYEARHRPVAAYRYRGDQWRLRLTGVRHVGQPLATVVLRDLDLVTVIGTDEPVRHQLGVRLLASGEQFTEFGIGQGSRLLTLLVDGRPARPVAGPDGIVRVELPPAREGLIDCQIRLAWEQDRLRGRAGRWQLTPPALPATAPLLASQWTVHAPDGYSYSGFDSNLRPQFDTRRPGLAARLSAAGTDLLSPLVRTRARASFTTGVAMPASEMAMDADYLMEAAADAVDEVAFEQREDSRRLPAVEQRVEQRVYQVAPAHLRAWLSEGHGRLLDQSEITNARVTDWFAAQGVTFSTNASARYDASSGSLIVTNTAQQHSLVERILAQPVPTGPPSPPSAPSPDDPFSAPARTEATPAPADDAETAPPAEPVVTGAPPPQAAAPPGLAVDRSGIETLALELPTSGRVFRFSGHEAPATLSFNARSWESQLRFAWIMLALGAAFFWRFASTRPLARGVPGLIVIAFLPQLILPESLWPLFNAMLLGWLAAMTVTLALALLRRTTGWLTGIPRPRADSPGAAPGAGATAAIAAAVLATLPDPASADQPGDPAKATGEPVRVVVPFDPSLPVDQQPQRPVYLDRATFERLWNAAADPAADPASDEATAATALPHGIGTAALARYEVELDDQRVRFHGQLQVAATEPWTRWPLKLGELPLTSLTINGLPARLRDGHVLLEHEGLHTIEFSLETAPERGWQTLTQPLPAAHSAGLSIRAGAGWASGLEVNDGVPLLEEALDDGGRSWTGALGAAGSLKLTRLPETRVAAMRPVASAELHGHLSVDPRQTNYQGRVSYRFPGGRQDRFTIDLDADWDVHSFRIENLRGWTVEPQQDGLRRFVIELAEPVADEFRLNFSLQPGEPLMLPADGTAVELSEPRIRIGAARSERRLDVSTAASVQGSVRQQDAPGWRRVPADPATPDRRAVGAFVNDGAAPPLAVELSWQPLDRELESSFVFQIGRDQLETIAILQFRQDARDLVTAILPLPSEAVVQEVQGERLAEWVRVGDDLLLRFDPGTRGATAVMVYLSQPVTDPGTVRLQPLEVRDWPSAGGRVRVVAHAAAEVLIDSEPGGGPVDDLPTEAAAGDDIMVVAPLETKRVLEFGEDGFDLGARISGLEPQVEAGWVQLVEARDGFAELRALVQLDVRRGAMESVRLHLPVGLPTAAITGPLVREVRRLEPADADDDDDAAPGTDIYEVSLQRDVLDFTRLEVSLELPYALAGGHGGDVQTTGRELELPLPEVEAAAVGGRYLLVSLATQDEVRMVAPEARPVPAADVPYLPDGRDSERVLAFAPGPVAARLEISELSTTAGSEAVVTLAELTSAIRENGDIWTRATYRLLNRSRQFLPVELPPGAELISVRVDGVGVRADRGTVDGTAVVLVPLIQADPGQVAYPVEVTYRQSTGRRLGRRAQPVLDDPNLPGISVQRTVWSVWLPEDYRLTDRDGNMEPVTAELSRVERLSAVMGELDRLNTVLASSATYDTRTREKAWQNAKMLQSTLEEETSGLIDSRASRRDQQTDEAAARLQDELQRQGQVLARNRLVFEQDLREQAQADAPSMPDGGDRPMTGWKFNDHALSQREQARQRQRQHEQDLLQQQLAVNDNIAINRSLLLSDDDAPPVQPGTDPEEAAMQQLRVGNTYNARQLELRQQAAPGELLTLTERQGKGMEMPADAFRGRGARPQELGDAAHADTDGAEADASPDAAPAPGMGAPPPAVDGAMIVGGVAGAPDDSARFGYDDHDGVSMVTAEALRSSGKVSLEIDFPLTGEPVHFRKSNDHARLELELRHRPDGRRLPALAGLVAGLLGWAVLVGLARRIRTR